MANNSYIQWLVEVEATTAVGDEAAAPVRRWWSGAHDLTFDNKTWEGTYSDDTQGSLVAISSVQQSKGVVDSRLSISLNVTAESARMMLARDFGSPKITLQWLWSHNSRDWQRIPRQFKGRVSKTTLDNGLLVAEIETLSGDVDRGSVYYWNDESHRQRYPNDTGFRHLRTLSTVGAQIRWPFNYD